MEFSMASYSTYPNCDSYPLTLPCPSINFSAQRGSTFANSGTLYESEQARRHEGTSAISASFICEQQEMKDFKDFYYSLNAGQKPFKANWEMNGVRVELTYRFNKNYQTQNLGAGKYKIIATFDMLEKYKEQ